jgi:excisionase family DNA binding protein
MNKEDVAKALGCSTRQIEKFASEGRLGERVYVRGKRGRQADYKPEEVERLKGELERERAEVIGHASPFAGVQALQRAGGEQGMSMLASVLADALRAAHAPADGAPPVPLRDKMTLSFREAAHLSGVPESHLREGYARGILRGAKIGRGVRVTPDDVRKYVEQRMKGKK